MSVLRIVRVAAVVGIAVLAAACGSNASGGGGGSQGVRGRVTLGPTCPVERADSPCPDHPVEGLVTALKRVGDAVGSARTSGGGTYFLALDPGTYLVYARELGDNPRLSKLQRVTVRSGQVVHLDLVIDSGIR
jgi:hypothetical protein